MIDGLPPGSENAEDILAWGSAPKIGPVLESLYAVIDQRAEASPESSYTAKLLGGKADSLLKKIGEEATEVVMAAKDGDVDQLRYESADLIYHLLVVFRRWGLTPDDLAAELRSRFK